MSERVMIVDKVGKYLPPTDLVDLILQLIITNQKLPEDTSVSLVFISSEESQSLNNEYRGKDYPTDVLSFTYEKENDREHDENQNFLGDILMCTDVLLRQAKEKKHSMDTEFSVLFIHGLLHLRGYDHEVDDEAELMEALEKSIFEQVSL